MRNLDGDVLNGVDGDVGGDRKQPRGSFTEDAKEEPAAPDAKKAWTLPWEPKTSFEGRGSVAGQLPPGAFRNAAFDPVRRRPEREAGSWHGAT